MSIKSVAASTEPGALSLETLPTERLYNIFSQAVYAKDLQSLWHTSHYFRQVVIDPYLWSTILARHFPGSCGPSQGVKPIDIYPKYLELENSFRSGICKVYRNCMMKGQIEGGDVSCVIEHEGNSITINGQRIAIWGREGKKTFLLKNARLVFCVDAVAAYKNKLFIASRQLTFTGGPTENHWIKVYNLGDGTLLKMLKGHDELITDLCKIENKLYSSSEDGTIKSWDMDTLEFCGTMEGHDKKQRGVMCLLPHHHTLYAGGFRGDIRECNLDTGKSTLFHALNLNVENKIIDFDELLSDCSEEIISGKMIIHGDKFISTHAHQVISVMDLISKQELYPPLKHEGVNAVLGFGRLLFSAAYNGRSVIIWDLNTGQKIRERILGDENKVNPFYASPFSLVMKEGNLRAILGEDIYTYDFAAPIEHEKKLKQCTTAENGQLLIGGDNSQVIPYRIQALQLALAQENRNKIIACVDNLMALDPRNKEFCEFLCRITTGYSTSDYESLKGKPFDYLATLQTATFTHINKAVDEFITKLRIDGIPLNENVPFTQFNYIDEPDDEN